MCVPEVAGRRNSKCPENVPFIPHDRELAKVSSSVRKLNPNQKNHDTMIGRVSRFINITLRQTLA